MSLSTIEEALTALREGKPESLGFYLDRDRVHVGDLATMTEDGTVHLVTLPDPALRWNEERQHYDVGPIDWSEFWRVVGGDGPCNRERLAARVDAWEDGAWVREAAMAHAAKHATQAKAA